uniref:DUF834 domain-containing protein n=1 Tax=Oryza nivara TaxID=4536 RepID=A0A0E0GZ96_ORYNI
MFLVPVFNTTRTIVKSGRPNKCGFSTSIVVAEVAEIGRARRTTAAAEADASDGDDGRSYGEQGVAETDKGNECGRRRITVVGEADASDRTSRVDEHEGKGLTYVGDGGGHSGGGRWAWLTQAMMACNGRGDDGLRCG